MILQNTWTSNSKFYKTPEVNVITSLKELRAFYEEVKGRSISYDLETKGLRFWSSDIICMSFSIESGKSFVLPFYHQNMVPTWNTKDLVEVNGIVKELLEDEETEKIGYNIKFDNNFMRYRGIAVNGPWFDGIVAFGLIDENSPKDLMTAADRFGVGPYGKWDDAILQYVTKKDPDYSLIPDKDLWLYTGIDATATFELREKTRRVMRKEGVYEIFTDISMPLLECISDMEYEGVLLDVPLLDEYSKDYEIRAEKKLQFIKDLVKDQNFNPNSPKQLGEKLEHELAGGKKTATGRISTDEESLQKLVAKGNVLAIEVLALRNLVKTRSTFMEGFKELLDDKGYIHTNYSIAHTVTGRISSNHPNLQNIPRVRPNEANIRAMFTVEKDYSFVAADYAQMEQRIIALLSGDKKLEDIFKKGLDIHTIVGSKILKKDPEDVTKEERARAKGVVFGVSYGRSSFDIATEYNMSNSEAEFFISEYFKEFPQMATWRKEQHNKSQREHRLISSFGRKRRFVPYGFLQDEEAAGILGNFEIKYALNNMRNMSYNFPIQSSASDYLSKATYAIWKELRDQNMKSKLIMSIHDAINLKVWDPELEDVKEIIIKHTNHILKQNGVEIPILTDIKVGTRWEELTKETK